MYVARAANYVDALFSGSKAALRPLYDKLYDLARSIGDDIKISPSKTIVPIYRQHVIAQIKPTTRTRIDFGLAPKDTPSPPTTPSKVPILGSLERNRERCL